MKQDNAETKASLEKQILTLSSKLKETESENFQLRERLGQEERLKEEYHKSFKRAQFDLDKIQERVQTDKSTLSDKVYKLEDKVVVKQNQLDASNQEIKDLKDENHSLRSTIVNKDSQNQGL